MKVTIGELRKIIRNAIAGSHPEESYDKELFDDPAFLKKSMYVPDEVKEKMTVWAKDMKLSNS